MKPGWSIHESGALMVCPWNRYVLEGGKKIPHPEY